MAFNITNSISAQNISYTDSSLPAGSLSALSNTNTFFMYEPGEVLDIILDDTHEYYENPLDIGKIKYRLITSETGKLDTVGSFAYPIDPYFKKMPVMHEIVIIVNFLNKIFYTDVLNFFNYINNNAFPHISTSPYSDKHKLAEYKKIQQSNIPISKNKNSLGKNFKDNNYNIPFLKLNEGDTVLCGRFGNYITFTSNPKTQSPAIKLSLIEKNSSSKSLMLKDNELLNQTSIWATSDEDISFTKHAPELIDPIDKYNGKQIYIGSDRIIFNAMNNEIIGFSNKYIQFTTNKDFIVNSSKNIKLKCGTDCNIENTTLNVKNTTTNIKSGTCIIDSSNIQLGNGASQPAVLGNELISVLNKLLRAITSLTVICTAPGTPSSPITNINDFVSIQNDLQSIISKTTKIK